MESTYVWTQHVAVGRGVGLSDEEIQRSAVDRPVKTLDEEGTSSAASRTRSHAMSGPLSSTSSTSAEVVHDDLAPLHDHRQVLLGLCE